jgi:cell division septation protein DedD
LGLRSPIVPRQEKPSLKADGVNPPLDQRPHGPRTSIRMDAPLDALTRLKRAGPDLVTPSVAKEVQANVEEFGKLRPDHAPRRNVFKACQQGTIPHRTS